MSKYTHSTLESLEMRRKLKAGKISNMEIINYRAKQHGFINHKDFLNKLKIVVYSMIQLKQDYVPIIDMESRYDRVSSLLEIFKNITLKCACCGESHIEFLGIDHIHNNGAEHRKNNSSRSMSEILFSEGFIALDYQILCNNCNISLGNYGYCPHHPFTEKREQNGLKMSKAKNKSKTTS